jgi:HlyD family secretion protein
VKRMILLLMIAAIAGCSSDNGKSDAYGNFEAEEINISSEISGRIMVFSAGKGDRMAAGDTVAIIDTTQLVLQRKQLEASKRAVKTKIPNIMAQIEVLEEQRATARKNLERIEKMLKDQAATERQYDDIKGKIDVINKQIKSIKTQNQSVFAELESIDAQIAKINDMISRAYVVNPTDGIILNKFAEAGELAAPARPLYKIAPLDTLTLRVYISGAQLPDVKIGRQADIIIDKNKDDNTKLEGSVSWIASEAEFTPKIIQTKEERVNLVYAVDIEVPNPDGTLKIGMPGEANFK